MNRFRFVFQTIIFAIVIMAFSSLVNAQSRTWVSGVGDDVNPCARTTPCKTFAKAISVTATGGEINCLDAGGFGAVTITKSITIDCTDVVASILGAGTTGIIINLGTADAAKTVRIRGVSINGVGTGINGIRIIGPVTNVFVEDVIIDGFSQHGISVETTSGAGKIVISNATISNNAGNGFNTFLTGSASANLSVNNSLFASNNIGFNLGASVKSSFQGSFVTGNNTGVLVNAGALVMANCQVSGNGVGVQAGSGGVIRMSGNVISGNTTGIAGASVNSFGNNVIKGNVSDGTVSFAELLN